MHAIAKICALTVAMLAWPLAVAQNAPAQSKDDICLKLTGETCGPAASAGVRTGAEGDFSFRRSAAAPASKPAAAPLATKPAGAARSSAAAVRPVAHGAAPSVARPPAVRAVASLDMRLGFSKGSAQLTPRDQANAREFAQALQSERLAARRVRIEGHTDSVGGREYNLKLSQDRASAVQQFLIAQGVNPSRLDSAGYGFDRPVVKGKPQAPSNRRVELVLVD